LNRGGDRHANAALYRIVTVRRRYDQRTQGYVAKRTAEGKTARELTRCLKRYVANEVYTLITSPTEVPSVDDLRPLRQHHKIDLLYGFRTRALLVLTKLEGHTESETVDSTPSLYPGIQRPVGSRG